MLARIFTVVVFVLVAVASNGYTQAILSIEDECANRGESVDIDLLLDNSSVGGVAAIQVDISFNKAVFTVESVHKTTRSLDIDLFMHSENENGITLVATGLGHVISPGTGPVARIAVQVMADAPYGPYDWALDIIVLSDPLGVNYQFVAEDATFEIPCGDIGDAVLGVEDICADKGETATILLTMDNTEVGEVAGGEIEFRYEKSVFTVTDVEKTSRSQSIDVFLWSFTTEGVLLIFSGIQSTIAAGTGPITQITVDVSSGAPNNNYVWSLANIILGDPLGNEYSFVTEEGTVQVPCGECVEPYVKPSDAVGAIGDNVTVNISIEKNPTPVDAFSLDLTYDPTMLSYLGISPGPLMMEWS